MSYINKSYLIKQALIKSRENIYIVVEKDRRKRKIKRHAFKYVMENEGMGMGYYSFRIKKGYTVIDILLNDKHQALIREEFYRGGGTFEIELTLTLSDVEGDVFHGK